MKPEVILLGIIQGLTEWIPISSTGHIRLIEILLGMKPPLLFDVALHIGTVIVTIVFFRRDIKGILDALVKLDFNSDSGLLLQNIFIGSIFTAITGLTVTVFLEELFCEVKFIGFFFILSGLLIYFSRAKVSGKDGIDFTSAAIIGVAQGFSIIPGLSRSGLTISVALMLGVKREEAFKFSFLLSIPAILGALILMSCRQYSGLLEAGVGLEDIALGVFISMLLGYISLKFLRRFLHKFHIFSFYPVALGLALILFSKI